jgi:hypothetical protein
MRRALATTVFLGLVALGASAALADDSTNGFPGSSVASPAMPALTVVPTGTDQPTVIMDQPLDLHEQNRGQ